MKMRQEYPLVCPFCDEIAYAKKGVRRIVLPSRIYVLRKCIMGHEFYSVEDIPENQAEITDEVKQLKRDSREWLKDLKNQPGYRGK